jgi:uncharacterized protein (DUF1330 family)
MQTRYVVALSALVGVALGAIAVQALHAQAKPPAYVVVEVDVINPNAYLKQYAPLAQRAIKDGGGNYIALGGKTVGIDGDPPKSRAVLIAFNSLDKAQAAFASTAYRDARKIGEKYAKFRIWAVEGLSQ